MPANTTRGYPYPLTSDNVSPPSDFQALASAVDTDVAAVNAKIPQIQFGIATLVFSAVAAQTAAVTFVPAFNNTPVVQCQIVSSSGSAIKSTPLITVGPSTTGFTVRVDLAASATVTITVGWTATGTY